MSGRKNSQKRSNHFVGPDPVTMVRSTKPSSSALQLIDQLTDEPQQKKPTMGSVQEHDEDGFEGQQQRGRRPSGGSSVMGGRSSTREQMSRSSSRGLGRMSSRTPSRDSLGHREPPRQDEYFDDDRKRSGYMTAQEQAHYFYEDEQQQQAQRRSRRPTIDKREQELRKRANKVWGRSPYHPLAVLEGTWSYVSQRRILLWVLVGVLATTVLAGMLVGFLVWPRAVTVKFVSIEHDQSPSPYRVIPREKGVHVRVQSWVNVQVRNPNFSPATIKRSTVTANWVSMDGREDMFGGSTTDAESTVGKRQTVDLRLPITIEYMGSPDTDPLYVDFIERCYEAKGDGKIYLNFKIEVTTEAKQKERTGVLLIDRSMNCPMGRDQIKKVLRALQ